MKLENELCKTTINGGSCGRIFHDVCNFRLWCMNMKNVNVKVSRRSSTTTGRHQIRSSSISSYTGEVAERVPLAHVFPCKIVGSMFCFFPSGFRFAILCGLGLL